METVFLIHCLADLVAGLLVLIIGVFILPLLEEWRDKHNLPKQ